MKLRGKVTIYAEQEIPDDDERYYVWYDED